MNKFNTIEPFETVIIKKTLKIYIFGCILKGKIKFNKYFPNG